MIESGGQALSPGVPNAGKMDLSPCPFFLRNLITT